MKRKCYFCPKKENCYSQEGLETLSPNKETNCGYLERMIETLSKIDEILTHTTSDYPENKEYKKAQKALRNAMIKIKEITKGE